MLNSTVSVCDNVLLNTNYNKNCKTIKLKQFFLTIISDFNNLFSSNSDSDKDLKFSANTGTMQFLVKSEPIETNGKILSKYTDDSNRHFHEEIKRNYIRNKSSNISFKKNKYSLISKLRHDLAQERDLNEKFQN